MDYGGNMSFSLTPGVLHFPVCGTHSVRISIPSSSVQTTVWKMVYECPIMRRLFEIRSSWNIFTQVSMNGSTWMIQDVGDPHGMSPSLELTQRTYKSSVGHLWDFYISRYTHKHLHVTGSTWDVTKMKLGGSLNYVRSWNFEFMNLYNY